MMKLTAIVFALIVFVNSAQCQEVAENEGLEHCQCTSTFEYLPLCASNGVTYSNNKMLECARNCLKRNDLTKVHDGHCSTKKV